jgi:acetyl-CoA carboxylase biotin carboxyl carrier protein
MPPKRLLETRLPLKEIRELVELVLAKGLTDLEVSWGDTRIRIRREAAPPAAPELRPAGIAAPGVSSAPLQAAEGSPTQLVTIEAPMVGTFYRAPSPEAPPYVREGDPIKVGQILCIIEAMKLMNEIESRVAGRIVKVLAENAQPVEYGQPLFLVEPV